MIDPARIGRLTIEPADGVGVLHQRRIHHLERALAAHLHVFGEIDLAHPAFTELSEHVIAIGDDRADQITGGVLETKRRSVLWAEALVELILGSALRTDLWTAHALSTRRI